ncbi:MAG TPA: DUF2620 family protein [Symbiobacteriaceae bacterium]|jgi:ABC-type amino acid transport substrate-binding protein
MLRIVVSGVAKQEIARAAAKAGGDQVQVTVLSDIEAARAVKDGRADVMIGSCATGLGGALGMAIALLGRDRCVTLATAGRTPRPDEVKAKAVAGSVAFGVIPDAVDAVVPPLVAALLAR